MNLGWLWCVSGRLIRFNKCTILVGGVDNRGGYWYGGDRGWDSRMASLTQWTWVWVGSRSWWRTGRLGMLPFTGLQRVRHDWATELNWAKPRDALIQSSTELFKSPVLMSLVSWNNSQQISSFVLLSASQIIPHLNFAVPQSLSTPNPTCWLD